LNSYLFELILLVVVVVEYFFNIKFVPQIGFLAENPFSDLRLPFLISHSVLAPVFKRIGHYFNCYFFESDIYFVIDIPHIRFDDKIVLFVLVQQLVDDFVVFADMNWQVVKAHYPIGLDLLLALGLFERLHEEQTVDTTGDISVLSLVGRVSRLVTFYLVQKAFWEV